MIVIISRHMTGDDLQAAVGRVRSSLTLFTVRMANIVRILFVKLKNKVIECKNIKIETKVLKDKIPCPLR